ncbi:unnamed protein product [Lepidochelys olivacea]
MPGSPSFKRCLTCREAIPVTDDILAVSVPQRGPPCTKLYFLPAAKSQIPKDLGTKVETTIDGGRITLLINKLLLVLAEVAWQTSALVIPTYKRVTVCSGAADIFTKLGLQFNIQKSTLTLVQHLCLQGPISAHCK